MKYAKTIVACMFAAGIAFASASGKDKGRMPVENRYPLIGKPYMELPIGDIKPEGWLKEQLERMCDGMTGHLDELYAHVMGERNGWKGGDGDVWERGPYWIDGLLPLAYIMDDKDLIAKAQPWIEWTLASQKEDGYFGPDTDRPYEPGLQRGNARDWWPKMVMIKVMQQYYSATGDERVIDFLTKYFRYQLDRLPSEPLGKWTFWGEQRGGDNLSAVWWLYNITGDSFLLELGDLIHRQTFNWTDVFLYGNHLSRQNSLHCVNLAQGFKEPVIWYQRSHDKKQIDAVKKAVSDMKTTIGYPTGLWAGDELLRFGDPVLGSELCTAVEMMHSLEEIIKITGDVQWMDHLERIAYNALPTQITDDFDARQYYQQLNQVEVSLAKRNFSTPHEDTDIVFGLLTGYPCCTSNLHQGWPKFVQNLWYSTMDGGIAALVYAPSVLQTTVCGGVPVTIRETTDYPFNESVCFDFSFPERKAGKASFPMHFRVPGWSGNSFTVEVNGEKIEPRYFSDGIVRIDREWKDGDKVRIEFLADVNVERWYGGAAVVERGPLVYALKMDEKWEKKVFPEGRKHYGEYYYEITSGSPWNYSLPDGNLRAPRIKEAFAVEKSEEVSGYPWNTSNAPVTIRTKARMIPKWHIYNGSAGPVNYFTQEHSDTSRELVDIELIPYGCTTLRITAFPVR